MRNKKAKLKEQKQNPKQPNTCNSNNQPQEKNKEKKLLVWFFWVGSQNTFTCVVCFFHITLRESLDTDYIIFRNVENFKGIFLAMKKAFFCEGKQGIFQNIPKSCMLVDVECSKYIKKNVGTCDGTNGKCFALPFWKDGRWWWVVMEVLGI
jgi:hypothetical protein